MFEAVVPGLYIYRFATTTGFNEPRRRTEAGKRKFPPRAGSRSCSHTTWVLQHSPLQHLVARFSLASTEVVCRRCKNTGHAGKSSRCCHIVFIWRRRWFAHAETPSWQVELNWRSYNFEVIESMAQYCLVCEEVNQVGVHNDKISLACFILLLRICIPLLMHQSRLFVAIQLHFRHPDSPSANRQL